MPDPREAIHQYVEATRSGDAEALYKLMSTASQRDYGLEGTRRLLADSQKELTAHGEAVAAKDADVEVVAEVPFVDGETATLVGTADGGFRVESASALPARAQTPELALAQLRSALARRSYAALTRVLTQDTAGRLEAWLDSLVQGLEEPESLQIDVDGDRATVELPGGHRIELERREGVWRVKDFE